MLQELTQSLRLHSKGKHVLWELIACISTAVGADGFRLYLSDANPQLALSLYLGEKNGKPVIEVVDVKAAAIPYFVANTREPVRISRGDEDPRFPNAVPPKVNFCFIHFFLFLMSSYTSNRVKWRT